MNEYYIGVDMGTSSIKVLLIDEKKEVASNVLIEYQASKPIEGWQEIEPTVWFDCMVDGIKKAVSNIDVKSIKGIGITGQMHTLVILDKHGKSIRPAIMWNDSRTKDVVPKLKAKFSEFKEGSYLSKTVSIGSPASNLYWLKENEPDNYQKIEKILIGPDYLVSSLTGTYGTDYCEASTSCLYEPDGRQWSDEIMSFLELKRTVYPEIYGAAHIAGKLKPEVAVQLGIPEGIPVLTGTGDNPATAVATGSLLTNSFTISLGTSGVLLSSIIGHHNGPYGKRILFSLDGSNFMTLVQGTIQSVGSTISWLIHDVFNENDFGYIDRLVASDTWKKCKMLFYPHLSGDKTIYSDPKLRGALLGLSLDSDRSSIIYAVLEGICFGFRELLEKMQIDVSMLSGINVVGGGSNSSVWMQTLANVLNKSVIRDNQNSNPAYGIALLSYQTIHEKSFDNKDDSKNSMHTIFMPDSEAVNYCDKKYKAYKKMHDAIDMVTAPV